VYGRQEFWESCKFQKSQDKEAMKLLKGVNPESEELRYINFRVC